jgi:hypothetical protein
MAEPRTRAQMRLTRALAWQQVLADHRQLWSERWSPWYPDREGVNALLDAALADAVAEVEVARGEVEP